MTPTEIAGLNIVSLLVGFFVGNRLAIGRDRRREFNALIEPIRADLLGIRNHPGNNLRGAWVTTFILICEKLPFWKRKGFDRIVENYKKSKGADNQERDKLGGFSYKDTTKIVYAANDLLKYLKPR